MTINQERPLTMSIQAKDLTKEAPRSPRVQLGGYPLLARSLDKGRAALNGTAGEYHFDCPLDNFLFGFKEVKGSDIKALLEKGSSDGEIVSWLDTHGVSRTGEEIVAFAKTLEQARPYDNPEKKEWFIGECAKVGLDASKSTMFEFLEKDDEVSFKK